SLANLSPRSFRDSLLWPVVWASEGLSGKAALDRSRQLCRAVGGSAVLGILARQYGPPAFLALIYPAMMTIFGGRMMLQFLIRAVVSGTPLGFFCLLFPLLPAPFYLNYGPSFSFLYWSALRCRGEIGDIVLPASTRGGQRNGFSTGIRPASRIALVLPVLLALLMIGRILLRERDTALETALNEGRRTAVFRALNSGLSVNERLFIDETPLFEAIRSGDLALVQALLSRGADVNIHSRSGNTPLLTAVGTNREDVARLLLDKGAALDDPDQEGRNALMVAA